MKRIVVLLLCLCMLLPMVFAMTAVNAGAEATVTVSTDKEVYAPGEAIKVTAPAGNEKDWVGIVPADANGDPIISQGTIYWKYVGEGLTASSLVEGATAINTAKGDALAALMGMTRAEMLTLPEGRYFVARIPNDLGIPKADEQGLVTYVPITIASKITMEKTTFAYGEDIPVIPLVKNTEKDYIGLSRVDNDGNVCQNLYYTYITDAMVNTPININEGVLYGSDKANYGHLPAGRYVVYFAPNDAGAQTRDKSSDIHIEIKGLTTDKTDYKVGEPIMVTASGGLKDWVGIGLLNHSSTYKLTTIRWRYITHNSGNPGTTGYGSGETFDIAQAQIINDNVLPYADLPAGEYVIYLVANNGSADSASSESTYIYITVSDVAPDAPASATLSLNDARTGLAGGKLAVTFAEESMAMGKKPTKLQLYWADENGDKIVNSDFGAYDVTGAVTEIAMPDCMLIPAEAKSLMVRAYNGAGYADAAVAAALPADRGYRATGAEIASFQIVSDMHIGYADYSSEHAIALFNDILAIDPDSVGIFVAGDAADHGQAAEYEELFALWQASGLDAQLYLGVGNHEMMKDTSGHNYNDDYQVQIERFLTYANKSLTEAEKTETPYYYVNRGGQHFIFLATEECGTHAYLSDAQLDWLEAKLGEVAADGAPVFIMLHQGLYNSIAGTLEGQGWNGIICGEENFNAWKALAAEKGVTTSNHTYMKGQYEQPLRDILAQYPSAMMFSGHSHWIMESLGNVYNATEAQPNYLFNTASVSYLWTDRDEMNGGQGTDEGSQGYFVTVYENCIEVRGRDILNGEWINGASYQIWLDCAHEYDFACATGRCVWCGEADPEAPACVGENECSTTCATCHQETVVDAKPCTGSVECSDVCIYCGENTVADAVACTGEFDCSTKCMYCGEAVTPRVAEHSFAYLCTALCDICGEANPNVVPCSGKFDCSTKCEYCGKAVTPRVETHTFTYACDENCSTCGEANPDVQAHKGLYDCSDKCQYCGIDVEHEAHVGANGCEVVCKFGCGTAVSGTGHEREFDCSVVCKNCGSDMTEGAAAHEGVAACATACKYGCGTAVTPDAEAAHAGEFDCSEICAACGEAIAQKTPHAGEFACSDKCATCGCDIQPASDHIASEVLCSGLCTLCNTVQFTPAAHEGAAPCATVCKYGCETAVEPTAEHDAPFDCSAICTVCNESIAHAEHEGVAACATVCKYGCGTAVTAADEHTAAFVCSETCAVCEETITPDAAHSKAHACTNACDVCGAEMEATAAHTALFACSTGCAVCGETIEPAATHTTVYECDTKCAVCNEDVAHKAHDGEFACSTVCQYGCGTVIEDAVPCVGAIACRDEICQYCGAEVEVKKHEGAYRCSTVCQYGCGIAIKPKMGHVKVNACSDVCTICGETTTRSRHTYDNTCDVDCNECGFIREAAQHVYDNSCDASCNVCGAARTPAAHEYVSECADLCRVCHAEREAFGDHSYNGDCDTICDACGKVKEQGEHSFGDWTVLVEATLDATGLREHACVYCGEAESEEIPKLTVDPNALNSAPTVNLPVVGEVDQNTFILVVAIAGGVLLLIVIAIIAGAKKKKNAKKAKKAEKAEATEEKAEETEATEGEAEVTEEETEEKTEEKTEEATEADETEKKDEE